MLVSAASFSAVEPMTPLPAAQMIDHSSSCASLMNRSRSDSSAATAASCFPHGTACPVNVGPIDLDTALPSKPPRPTIQLRTTQPLEHSTALARSPVAAEVTVTTHACLRHLMDCVTQLYRPTRGPNLAEGHLARFSARHHQGPGLSRVPAVHIVESVYAHRVSLLPGVRRSGSECGGSRLEVTWSVRAHVVQPTGVIFLDSAW